MTSYAELKFTALITTSFHPQALLAMYSELYVCVSVLHSSGLHPQEVSRMCIDQNSTGIHATWFYYKDRHPGDFLAVTWLENGITEKSKIKESETVLYVSKQYGFEFLTHEAVSILTDCGPPALDLKVTLQSSERAFEVPIEIDGGVQRAEAQFCRSQGEMEFEECLFVIGPQVAQQMALYYDESRNHEKCWRKK
mmetsp:Transcript_6938/g.10673  ORF Transcript_6938/g.10673 Transcript_6938/m.10673 type:complete len:195 (+) Transcript_6938:3-587(+)